jgi:lipoprotein-releasing system permease protein
VGRGDEMRGAIVRGIDRRPRKAKVTAGAQLQDPRAAGQLQPGEWNIVLGASWRGCWRARIGDKVTIVAPGGQVTPAGVVPRLKQFTLVGTFEAGPLRVRQRLALIHVDDAARLFRVEGPTGVQLRLADVQAARRRRRAAVGAGPRWWCATGRAPTATGSTRCRSRSG